MSPAPVRIGDRRAPITLPLRMKSMIFASSVELVAEVDAGQRRDRLVRRLPGVGTPPSRSGRGN
jgi:hypothetical protein